MADSFSKKENFKKKLQKQKEKAQRHEERIEVDIDNIQLGAAPIEAEETLKKGIVTFLSDKGYGFITEDNNKENVFFHGNNADQPLKKGNRVSFEKEKSPKGFSAVNITLIK